MATNIEFLGRDGTEQLVATVKNLVSNMSAGGESAAIIDVLELPSANINKQVFYRLLTGTFVYNRSLQNTWKCYCVKTLPETGDPAFAGNLSDVTTVSVTAYYNLADSETYCYVTTELAPMFGVSAGWYTCGVLMTAVGYTFNGVITDIADDPQDNTFRVLLEYSIYLYEDKWILHETIGSKGSGLFAETFNEPTNEASGNYAHAEGKYTHAEGHVAHTEGYNTFAKGDYSHAEGFNTYATGTASHAEGRVSHAKGPGSHAEGGSIAQGVYSHAEGWHTLAEGDYSHSEGKSTGVTLILSGEGSATTYEVNTVQPVSIGSFVILYVDDIYKSMAKIVSIDSDNNTVTLDKTLSEEPLSNMQVAVYASGIAHGDYSHSEGSNTIAAGRSQHVQGEYNIIDPEYNVNDNAVRGKYVHIVGNGTGSNDLSNAHTLDWSGNAWYQGDVYVGGTGQDDENAAKLMKAPNEFDLTTMGLPTIIPDAPSVEVEVDNMTELVTALSSGLVKLSVDVDIGLGSTITVTGASTAMYIPILNTYQVNLQYYYNGWITFKYVFQVNDNLIIADATTEQALANAEDVSF